MSRYEETQRAKINAHMLIASEKWGQEEEDEEEEVEETRVRDRERSSIYEQMVSIN